MTTIFERMLIEEEDMEQSNLFTYNYNELPEITKWVFVGSTEYTHRPECYLYGDALSKEYRLDYKVRIPEKFKPVTNVQISCQLRSYRDDNLELQKMYAIQWYGYHSSFGMLKYYYTDNLEKALDKVVEEVNTNLLIPADMKEDIITRFKELGL